MTYADGTGFTLGSVARSTVILTIGNLVAQVLVVVRELFLADRLGAAVATDTLFVGIILPISLGGILTTGATVAFVPAYLDAARSQDLAHAKRFAGAVLGWAGLGGLLLSVGLYVFAEVVVAIMGSGLAAEARTEAVHYLRVVSPCAFVLSVSGILLAFCQAEARFRAMAFHAIATAGITAAVVVLLWPQWGPDAYALGSLAGPLVGLAFLVAVTARSSIAPLPRLVARGVGLPAFFRHATPLTISSSILQVNAIASTAVSSSITPGAVSAVRFATLLVSVPIGAVGLAWGKAVYPALVHSAHDDRGAGLASAVDVSIRYIFAIFVPIAALTAALAPLAVGVVFGRGAFGESSVELTSIAVVGLAPVIVTLMVRSVLTGALNARRKGMTLMTGGFLNVAVNTGLTIILGLTVGIIGVTFATSVTAICVAVFFANRLRRAESALSLTALSANLRLAVAAAAPVAILLAAIAWTIGPDLDVVVGVAGLALASAIGGVGYLLVASRLGYREPGQLLSHGVAAIRRQRQGAARG